MLISKRKLTTQMLYKLAAVHFNNLTIIKFKTY
jgi:hypothetical protein